MAGTSPGLWALSPVVKPLKILILGGTGFIGPHIVNAAIARNHSVTLFNRGKSDPGLFPGVETIIGDRNDNIEGLKGREWDIVIDNSEHESDLCSQKGLFPLRRFLAALPTKQ